MAAVGCRFGEALALDVTDYDPRTGALSITKTYDRRHGVRPPKSENGVRTVTVPEEARPAFAQAAGGRRAGPLFAKRDGTRRHHRTLATAWRRLLAELGVRYRNPHQLRHSVATHWIAGGVGVGDVAKHLGDSVETVVRTYVHASGVDPAAAMDRVLRTGRKLAREADGGRERPGKRRQIA
jgi:integrase